MKKYRLTDETRDFFRNMKDYKRLTKRSEEFGIIALCPACSRKATCEKQEECVDCLDEMQERLAELEDKIENGTLVELPCKVGDTVYEVFNRYNRTSFIQETTIEKIIVTAKGLKLKLARNSFYETAISSVGKTLFLTKAEAEKALAELEENNGEEVQINR